MNFSLNETQQLVQDTARRFADSDLRPQALARDAAARFPVDCFRQMAELGLMGVNIGEEFGGSAAGVVAYSLAITEIAKGDPAIAVTMAVNNMVAEVIQQFGSDSQKNAYIPALTSGRFVSGSFCLSEPGSGSDASGMLTRAQRTPCGWRISGSKAWITSGSYSDIYLVWAKHEDAQGKDIISLFIVEKDTPGVIIGKPEKKLGQHASDTVAITFDNVLIPHDAVLGEEGQGFKIAMMALDGGRIGIASQALGIGLEALRLATEYTQDRRQFGRALAEFQATQFKLADMATELDAARLLTLRAAWLKEQGTSRFTRQASMAKLFASEAAGRACDEALQLHGGYGYTKEYPVEKLYRDVRVTRIYEGTSEIQRIVIARDVLKHGGNLTA